MAASSHNPNQEVGWLVFCCTSQPGVEQNHCILANAPFDVGRVEIRDFLHVEDRCISTHHIRVHCVVYEDDAEQKVAPMVWVRVLSSNPVIFHAYGVDGPGMQLTRDHGGLLLNHLDSIHVTPNVHLRFESVDGHSSHALRLDDVQTAEVNAGLFGSRYSLSPRVLGFGGSATVYIANRRNTVAQLACKIVNKRNVNAKDGATHSRDASAMLEFQEKVSREFNLLQQSSHPNIIGLEQVYSTPFNVYIFQELVTAGDLMSYRDKHAPLDEAEAAMITRQVLEAVKYLHANNVVHRDIKPENILMTSWQKGARIVLTDFGQSRTYADVEDAAEKAGVFRMQSMVGTYGYVAPEVLRQQRQELEDGSGYSEAVDLWSVGCVSTTLLASKVIFPDGCGSSYHELSPSEHGDCLNVLDNDPEWAHIGSRAKDFLRGCLTTDARKRLTVTEALAMPWFTHPHYRTEFDAAYKRAISGWKPQEHDGDTIQHVDTTSLVETALRRQRTEVRSRHFFANPVAEPLLDSDPGKNSALARFRPIDDSPSLIRDQSRARPESQFSISTAGHERGHGHQPSESLPLNDSSYCHGAGAPTHRYHPTQKLDSIASFPPPPTVPLRKRLVH